VVNRGIQSRVISGLSITLEWSRRERLASLGVQLRNEAARSHLGRPRSPGGRCRTQHADAWLRRRLRANQPSPAHPGV